MQKAKDGSFVVITRNNADEVFLVLRSDQPIWNLPGGGIEPNERPIDAAIRETYEETGFTVSDLRYIGNYVHIEKDSEKVYNRTYLFCTSTYDGDFTPEFGGCEGRWFNVNKLPNELHSITALRIEDALKSVFFKAKIFKPVF